MGTATGAGSTGTTSKAAGGGTKKSTTKTVTKSSAGTTKAKQPKKKSTTKRADSATAYAASRQAQLDLASQWNNAAKKVTDSLWYRAEDVLPTIPVDSSMVPVENQSKILPEEIKIVDGALKKNGLGRSDVTPQAFACLLEQARRYAMEILTDSQDYAAHAGRTEIAKEDLILANEIRPDHPISVTTQLPKLNLLAQTANRLPLPPIPTQCYSGVLLPPKHHQLTARTFDVVTGAQTLQRQVQAAPTQKTPTPAPTSSRSTKAGSSNSSSSARESSTSGRSTSGKSKPGYGASKGRQISINLKDKIAADKNKSSTGGTATASTKVPVGGGTASAPSVTSATSSSKEEKASSTPAAEASATTSSSSTNDPTKAEPTTGSSTQTEPKTTTGPEKKDVDVTDDKGQDKTGPTAMDTSS